MRLTLPIVWLLAVAPALAGDWRASLSPPQPGGFPALPPLHASYRFGWGAIPAARAEFASSRTKQGEQRLTMTTATSGAVRALWKFDARHDALCIPATLTPLSVRQTESYSDETHAIRVTFDAEGVSRVRESTPAKAKSTSAKPAKTKRFKCPNVFDLQTGLLFVRSQPLRQGQSYGMVVYPSTSPFFAQVQVVGREKIQVAGRTWPAVKLDVKLHTIEKDLKLGPHRKFKKASAWLSDDADRVLLKVSAEVFVGSVWVELEKIEIARK